LSEGASVDARALDGRTPLMAAAAHNSAAAVAMLLAAGSHVAAREVLSGRTALEEARLRSQRCPQVEALLTAAENHAQGDKSNSKRPNSNCVVS